MTRPSKRLHYRPAGFIRGGALAAFVFLTALSSFLGAIPPRGVLLAASPQDAHPPPAYYRVQPGDTLTSIARRFGLSVSDLVAWNRIPDPDFIRAGELLLLHPEARWEPSRGELICRASEEEIELLARLVQAEAGAESYLGRVAVAAVVVNRVRSPQFPDTIKDVIYQPGQFPPVFSPGFSNLEPDRLSRQAALAALQGEDPTGGALYFYNPRLAVNRSFWATRTVLAEIGNHRFAI
ncbi:MAG TPA: LysM peptidoglycan-binding domain-containing protein [Firmicutes bacterium]|nr:LysM peptidoglycan-binding domain-containing protein [Bacillota bacterium]